MCPVFMHINKIAPFNGRASMDLILRWVPIQETGWCSPQAVLGEEDPLTIVAQSVNVHFGHDGLFTYEGPICLRIDGHPD